MPVWPNLSWVIMCMYIYIYIYHCVCVRCGIQCSQWIRMVGTLHYTIIQYTMHCTTFYSAVHIAVQGMMQGNVQYCASQYDTQCNPQCIAMCSARACAVSCSYVCSTMQALMPTIAHGCSRTFRRRMRSDYLSGNVFQESSFKTFMYVDGRPYALTGAS